MSIAGKRAGLDGSRSSLFYEAIRIIKEMRCATDGRYPRYALFENVTGAFSSNGGEDFRAVLEAFCSVKGEDIPVPRPEKWANAGEIVGDGFSVAWRVLDAQFFGVAQRRRRIYLVADFGGRGAGKILFESEGLSGYPPEGGGPWQGPAGGAADGPGEAGGDGIIAFHVNQRDETIDLHGVSGALMATRNMQMQTFVAETDGPPRMPELYENHSQDTRYTGPLETAPTVSATYGMGGNNQPFVVGDASRAVENHPADGRVRLSEDGTVQTLTSRMGTGGNNVPLVMGTPKTLKIRSGCEGGGKGPLVQDDRSATLSCSNDQTLFVPKAYGIGSYNSEGMKSDNPKAGFYEADTSRTLDCTGGTPAHNQGGIAVVEKPASFGIGRDAFNQGRNARYSPTIAEEIQPTMVAKGPGAVAGPVYSASKASFFTDAEEDRANTLVATDYKDPPLVNDAAGYAVRRLTPTECARLQGFPDRWAADLGTEDPTDEEIAFWTDVWETHRRLVSHGKKPKTEKQIRKWLADPHTDSAEYKMWGNGIALPCAAFVLAGIAWAHGQGF